MKTDVFLILEISEMSNKIDTFALYVTINN